MYLRYKKQIEDAEEIAALNLAKFRKSQQQLEEAEERSRSAEGNLIRMRGDPTPNLLTLRSGAERFSSPFTHVSKSNTLFSFNHRVLLIARKL